MSIYAALYARLGAVSGVTDLVSTRIYPLVAPQNASLPLVVVNRIGEIHEHHTTAAAGIARASMQIDCWAATLDAAVAVGDAVRAALDGWSGTSASIVVRSVTLNDRDESMEPPQDGEEFGDYRSRLDFTCWYQVSVPTF